MRIGALYFINDAKRYILGNCPSLYNEICRTIESVDAYSHTFVSKSKTKRLMGKTVYAPKGLNESFRNNFESCGWHKNSFKLKISYDGVEFMDGYRQPKPTSARNEVDFLKERVAVEVQFGYMNYSFYDHLLKMPLFTNKGVIDVGVSIIPMKSFTKNMSDGTIDFLRAVRDMKKAEHAGLQVGARILILGVDA